MIRSKRVVDKRYAQGRGDYEKVIAKIERQGSCPFCPANFKYHKKPILKRAGGWFITENNWPYKGASHHLIVISKKHKENFSELTDKDFFAMRRLVQWANKKFKIKGGAMALRFGDTHYTGATVCHLHFHLITPTRARTKLSKKPIYFGIG